MNSHAIAAGHAERLATVDALLPEMPALEPAEGSVSLSATAGDSAAAGLSVRTEAGPDSVDSPWRALVEHRLEARLTGPRPEAALDALLTRWDEHLKTVAPPGDVETAATVVRPSRDSPGSAELLRRGFAPVLVIAVRPADRLAVTGPPATPGVHIRPAEADDLETAVGLELELQRYDAQFGSVTLREGAEETITADLSKQLGRENPTLWIAELYGRPLGMVRVQFPGDTAWIRGRVAAEKVGYLSSLAVAEQARSSGVGTALAAHAHQVFDECGADAVLLHHALANPRSTPFWYAQGYRPLWTYWQRRPAVP
ncbi:GNAT family N-acetyltransferase [Amycolatopsis sp. WAC 04169]|uniref:GNAT family N-acetyltransferase n=1 Tax=Amycolatopsis sp. WAC 04169 TaxID=2203197 RepID=UPI000F7B1CE1|nr:GNAT family N-acetyltransferase [Amycolatopsis sp. WAC 04169]RSN27721.1 GNAT family N-acetyltransferase [Amycolatopsis sp. WAC 04169]